MTEVPESYDRVARDVLEQALGGTFEDGDAIPRRDAFIRDATDVLSQFVAARSGNPGFHSARFFDAVVALAAARDRIKEAARRSRVVERLIEAQRKQTVLEQRLRDRDEQMTALAKGDAGPVARALAAAETRLATLEEELAETRHLLGERQASPGEGAAVPPDSGLFPVKSPVPAAPGQDPARTARLGLMDEELFAAAGDRFSPPSPPAPIALPGEPGRAPERDLGPARPVDPSDGERELVELERDALRAQLEQIVEREKAVRAERNAFKQERDELLARSGRLESGERAAQLERERDEAVNARSLLDAAKRTQEQELAIARAEIQGLKQVVHEREHTRTRSSDRLEDALARARELEASLHRETQGGARARRESEDLRLERDRLRSALAELSLVRDRHRELLSALGLPSDLVGERLEGELARRREVVLVHETPAWDEATRGLERVRDRAPSSAAGEARARLARLPGARARYEALRGARGAASEVLELSRIIAHHEEDLRWAEAIEAVLDEGIRS